MNSLRGVSNTVAVVRDPVAELLARLRNVRKFGDAWRADCPVGHTSGRSLAIAVGHDGRALLHCFVGCAADEIVDAIGLRLSQLFPPRITRATLEENRQINQKMEIARWSAALNVLAVESRVALIAGRELKAWQVLSVEDDNRLAQAVERLESAANVLVEPTRWRPEARI